MEVICRPVLAIVCLPPGTVGTTAAVNGLADASSPQERTLPVQGKQSSSGKWGTTYYASVSAWDRAGETLDLRVSAAEYDAIQQGRSQVELATGRGRLGIEWIKDQRVRP